MTYEEYVLSKTNKLIYKGQSEEELKKILKNVYGYDYSIIPQGNEYKPIKPPAGTIFVGKDMNKDWITTKKSFFGWNIQFVKEIDSNNIRFK